MGKLTAIIESLIEEIAETVKSIGETKEAITKMEDERKAEHEEFQIAKKDDEDAIALLTKTVEVLSAYYKKEKIEMGPIQGSMKLLQQPEFAINDDNAPDAVF